MSGRSPQIELAQLAIEYIEDSLDDAGLAELSRRLAGSEADRERFAAICHVMAMISRRSNAVLCDEPSPIMVGDASSASRRGRSLRLIFWPLAAAALIGVAVGLAYMIAGGSGGDPDGTRSGAVVATLIDTTGEVFVNDDFAHSGGEYSAGTYSIESGSAELILTNRVGVKLKGKTSLTMHSNMAATLTRGSATFDCPHEAKGYTVYVPGGAKVVDLGTSFTVDIDPNGGPTVVRVIEGKVELREIKGYPNQSLVTGDFASLDAGGSLRSISSDAYEVHYVSPLAGPDGNTVNLADNSPTTWSNDNANAGNSRNNTDNLWGSPPLSQGFPGTMPRPIAWESTELEDSPAIRTTVGDLPPATYEVFVLWMNESPERGDFDWTLRAKLSADAEYLTVGVNRDRVETVEPRLFRCSLGTVIGTEFSVDIDDTPGDGDRSRYVGVAYRRVITPTTGTPSSPAAPANASATDSTTRQP